MAYASVADVRTALGKLGNRLPAEVDLDAFLAMTHSAVVDRLVGVYPAGTPEFVGDGLEALRWAEAKLTAADVLDVLRAATGDESRVAERMRASAWATVDAGIVGYPPGSSTDDPNAPGVAVSDRPRVSSSTDVSMFPDPYIEARDDPARPWV